MSLKSNKYFGVTTESITTESFNISLTNHSSNSEIPLHSHEKPYLCLLATGAYKEKSNAVDNVNQGEIIYRTSNYEHSNCFHERGGLCLNIEINDFEQFSTLNEVQLPLKVSKQKGPVELYKLLYGLQCGLPKDLIDVYYYESMIAAMSIFNTKGNIHWVEKVKELINDNPLENISLDMLSLAFSLHPNYIVRKFKEVSGYKLSEYLTRVRLQHSINNLLVSCRNITPIALESGFYDQSHFNRNFKKYIKATPNHFRKTLLG